MFNGVNLDQKDNHPFEDFKFDTERENGDEQEPLAANLSVPAGMSTI